MTPQITIAVQCHNFQRRLCWMLSSLAQQSTPKIVHVRIDHESGNGSPPTEEIIRRFAGDFGINISSKAWPKQSEFRFRGIVRNVQLVDCKTEWMMFADADMVYSRDYFETLIGVLESNHKTHPGLLSTGRMSNDKEECTKLVDQWTCELNSVYVESAFDKASSIQLRRKSNVGAGFSQIFNMKTSAHGGVYVDPKENRDWDWNSKGSNPRSDIQFRKKMNKLGGPRIALPEQFTTGAIHLNHNRDPDTGSHITEQR